MGKTHVISFIIVIQTFVKTSFNYFKLIFLALSDAAKFDGNFLHIKFSQEMRRKIIIFNFIQPPQFKFSKKVQRRAQKQWIVNFASIAMVS